MPVENSFKCIFADSCEEKTGIFHTNSHEIHTAKRWYNVIKETAPARELILYNLFINQRCSDYDNHYVQILSLLN